MLCALLRQHLCLRLGPQHCSLSRHAADALWLPVQWKHTKSEAEASNGANLNFQVYGNLSSNVWRENPPFPVREDVSICDVAFSAPLLNVAALSADM